MRSSKEIGHAKNVANFAILCDRCEAFGVDFKPSRPEMSIDSMRAVLVQCQSSADLVRSTYAAYTQAVGEREVSLAPLPKLVSRSLQALKCSESSLETDLLAMAMVRRFRGNHKVVALAGEATAGSKRAMAHAYVRLQGFDTRVDSLDQYIKLIRAEAAYQPKEVELSPDHLDDWKRLAIEQNGKVRACEIAYETARGVRDLELYHPNTGLVPLAIDIKAYVRVAFGSDSPRSLSVAGLRFARPS